MFDHILPEIWECDGCGEMQAGEQFTTEEGEVICQDCANSTDYGRCADCADLHSVDNLTGTAGGDTVCDDCLQNNYAHCEECEEWCPVSDLTTAQTRNPRGRWTEVGVCDDCRDRHYYRCQDCDTWTHGDFMSGDRCDSCYEDHCFTCDECGGTFHVDEMGNSSEGCYCEDCAQRQDNGGINDYSYRPDPEFYGVSPDRLYFGFELEVENVAKKITNAEAAKRVVGDETYCKHDGSLKDGFEIVSHPFSWEWYKENGELFDEILDYLTKNGFRSHDTTTCGMHVHLSKQAFTTPHLLRFLHLFYLDENRPLIVKISQREPDYLDRWGTTKGKDKKMLEEDAKQGRQTDGHRYTAVNMLNSETVEVRVFRGTLNKDRFRKNLEFLRAAYLFTGACDLDEVNIDNFRGFVAQNQAEFPNLAAFMADKGI